MRDRDTFTSNLPILVWQSLGLFRISFKMIVSLSAESTSRVELRSGPSWTREDRAKCRLATMAELLERSSSKNQRTPITWKKFSFYSPLTQTARTYKVLYTEKKQKSPFCFAQNWSTSIPLFFQIIFFSCTYTYSRILFVSFVFISPMWRLQIHFVKQPKDLILCPHSLRKKFTSL